MKQSLLFFKQMLNRIGLFLKEKIHLKKTLLIVFLSFFILSTGSLFYFGYQFYKEASKSFITINTHKIYELSQKSFVIQMKESTTEKLEISTEINYPSIKKINTKLARYVPRKNKIQTNSDQIQWTQSSNRIEKKVNSLLLQDSYLSLKKNFFKAVGDQKKVDKISFLQRSHRHFFKSYEAPPQNILQELPPKKEAVRHELVEIPSEKPAQKDNSQELLAYRRVVAHNANLNVRSLSEENVTEKVTDSKTLDEFTLFSFLKEEKELNESLSYEQWAGLEPNDRGYKAPQRFSTSKPLVAIQKYAVPEKVSTHIPAVLPTPTVVNTHKPDVLITKNDLPSPYEYVNPNYKQESAPEAVEGKVSALTKDERDSRDLSPEDFNTKDHYLDAFSGDTALSDYKVSVISTEGYKQDSPIHWTHINAPGYLETVYMDEVQKPEQVFLMSQSNYYAVLSQITSSKKIHPNLGLIYGRIKSGWKINVSSLSDEVLYWNDKMEPLHGEAIAKATYFAICNVTPGAVLIKLKHLFLNEETAAYIPVFSDQSTYLNLESFTKKHLELRVLTKNQDQKTSIENAFVRVLGVDAKSGASNLKGELVIKDVLSIANLPVVLDVDTKGGYTHRYSVYPKNGKTTKGASDFRDLYVQNSEDIDDYIYQHRFNVGENGMLITEHDHLNLNEGGFYFPSVSPFIQKDTVTPFSYIISNMNYLLMGQPLDPIARKTATLPLSEGFNVFDLKVESGDSVWSKLFISSPNVINVLND